MRWWVGMGVIVMMSSCINVNVEIWEDLEMVVLFGMGNTIMMHDPWESFVRGYGSTDNPQGALAGEGRDGTDR